MNYKKQTRIWFSFYIQMRYCNLILKRHWNWAGKNSEYLTGLGLTLWYIRLGLELIALGLILWYVGLGFEKYSDYLTGVRLNLRYIGLRLTLKSLNHLTGLGLLLLQIGVGLKKLINQEEMPLEKYEGFLELSVKQFIIQSNPISLGQITCGIWKTKH